VYPEGVRWAADVYGAHLTFESDPTTLATLSRSFNLTLSALGGTPLYIADEQAFVQLQSSLGQLLPLQEVCVGACARDVPEKTCAGSAWIVRWEREGIEQITQEGNCILLQGSARVVDAFTYTLLNLLP
jgi:hypothetical protein